MAIAADGDHEWWRSAVVYQIYPRSFADANADGIGDLPGVRSRLPYLADLGVDALWLSPFYPSPLADGGYDISDHRAVDPCLGTLEDFVGLTGDAHRLGLKILIDIVPNHTSEQHPWFRQALAAGRGSPERERYIFRDGTGPDGALPPSDWRSHFGGSAWERVDDGQWYCHLFARSSPISTGTTRRSAGTSWTPCGSGPTWTWTGSGSTSPTRWPRICRTPCGASPPSTGHCPWTAVIRSTTGRRCTRSTAAGGRSSTSTPRPGWRWRRPGTRPTGARTSTAGRVELGQVFDFSLLKAEWGRDSFLQVIHRSLGEHRAAGSGLTWVLSSHDVPRHPSRYALPPGVDPDDWLLSNGTRPVTDPQKAHRRGRAATLMMLALPGSAYLYQGEELGLLEVAELREEQLRDPVWERSGHQLKGRDGCRVPLPWTRSGSSFGFGDNGSWLPQPAWFADYAVDGQVDAPGSSLTLYRQALALRRRLHLADSSVAWLDAEDDEVIHFARAGGWQCLVNFSAHPRPVPPGEVLLSSSPIHDGMLPGEATVWLKGPPRVAGS